MGVYGRKIKIGWRYYSKGQHLNVPYCSKAIFLTKKQAEKWERAEKERIEAEARNPVPAVNFKELIERRLDDIQTRKSKDYYRESRRYFKLALDEWGDIDIRNISKAMVNDLARGEALRLSKEGKTYYKVNSLLRALKALFNYGHKLFDTDHNPCNLDLYPINVKMKYIPPDEDIEAVKALCNSSQRFLLEFADQTACRINEAVRFRYDDIMPNGIILWTRKSRNSNLTPRRLSFIPECLIGKKGFGKVFKYSGLPRFLERKIALLGQPVWSWHSLRHRRASIWATEGKEVFWIQHQLGHQNTIITMRYLQLLAR